MFTDEERADYERQQEDDRRRTEDEAARYKAAHPEHYVCPNHPERSVVDPHVCTKRLCAECLAEREHLAIDARIRKDLLDHATGEAYDTYHTETDGYGRVLHPYGENKGRIWK